MAAARSGSRFLTISLRRDWASCEEGPGSMSDQATARTGAPADGLQVLRLLALVAVAAGVGLLAAAAFVLSYPGIHAVALYAGVPPRLARIYPLIFDAMLVVACAAVLSLRGAG